MVGGVHLFGLFPPVVISWLFFWKNIAINYISTSLTCWRVNVRTGRGSIDSSAVAAGGSAVVNLMAKISSPMSRRPPSFVCATFSVLSR